MRAVTQSATQVSDAATPLTLIDEHIFLIGRPPMSEFIAVATALTVGGNAQQIRELSNRWRIANDHVRQLENDEARFADVPRLLPLPPELDQLHDQVLGDPVFQRSFQVAPSQVAMVELDRLVVFQKSINLEHVARVKRLLGESPSADAIFRCCLPFDHPQPPVRGCQIAPTAFVFGSPSNDLRFSEVINLDPQQVTGYSPSGPVSGIVALVVGFGGNFLNAIYAENRLVLNNGSHRAFALRDLGVTHVPCIVQHASRREELEVLTNTELASKPDYYLQAPRPPLLKDYFDPALRTILNVPRKNRQVKVVFGVETIDVPAQ